MPQQEAFQWKNQVTKVKTMWWQPSAFAAFGFEQPGRAGVSLNSSALSLQHSSRLDSVLGAQPAPPHLLWLNTRNLGSHLTNTQPALLRRCCWW